MKDCWIPKIVTAVLVSVILGSAIGFGLSYAVLNSQIQSLRNDLEGGYDFLSAQHNSLDLTVNGIRNNVTGLQTGLSNTQSNLNALNITVYENIDLSGWLPEPAYDSGWVSVLGEYESLHIFNHGLNNSQIFVWILRNTSEVGIVGQLYMGNSYPPISWFTRYWNGSSYVEYDGRIAVRVRPVLAEPFPAYNTYDEIRVLIGVIKS